MFNQKHFSMRTNEKSLSKKEFNEACQVADLLAAMGVGCYEQRGSLRHYMLINHKTGSVYDFTVNTARNEWISRRDNRQGQAADIFDYLHGDAPGAKHYFEHDLLALVAHYGERKKIPKSYPTVDVHIGMKSFVELGDLESHSAISLLTKHGISTKTSMDCGVREIKLHYPNSKEVVSRLALPCDNGSYYVFDGKTYRPLENRGISTMGTHKQFQVCNVFENWMDYLAFQERRHQTGQYWLANDYNVIMNGKGNVDKVMDFLRQNPDFLEVRSFMPATDEGRYLTNRVMEATKGTAVDKTSKYEERGSLAADILPAFPDWYVEECRKLKEQEEARIRREEEKRRKAEILRQESTNSRSQSKEKSDVQQPKEKVGKGKEREIVIERPRGGMHM